LDLERRDGGEWAYSVRLFQDDFAVMFYRKFVDVLVKEIVFEVADNWSL
jgi:hypothetical protein